ncbi:hypothetical protein NHQ30_005383 [Ciborinia camelliae]|nr:hypothetical protein NHQ30_005383 [Ciborinia camelliae]
MAAFKDPNACPIHGYNLEWRTCLNCDIIKLNTQGSVNFADLGDTFNQAPNPQYTTQWPQTARPTERQFQEQQRSAPQVISTTYFSAGNPYNFNTFEGRDDDYPERFALTASDNTNPEDLALSDEEKAAKPRRRRTRLQKKAKNKSRAEEADDGDDDMEHLALSDEELPQEYRGGTSKKGGARGRHVKFSE